MNKLKLLSLALLLSIFVIACSDDDKNPTDPTKNLIEATEVLNLTTFTPNSSDTIVYFSLRENKVIDPSRANTADWDVMFHRTNIYVNQGFRGPGNGGAFVLRATDFETLEELPADSTFYQEISAVDRAIPTGSQKGWYNYDFNKMEITPIPGVVLAIKTADGRYAKMKILSYYGGYPNNIPEDPAQREDRVYSFRFVFQPDGTKSFKK